MYIMNIYKYIYNDDTVIHNNYKMINDKKTKRYKYMGGKLYKKQ